MNIFSKLIQILVLVTLIPLYSYSASPLNQSVMLQGFHWESHMTYPWWGVIDRLSQEIAEAGFDLVWLPPSSQAASDEGYLPNKLYTLNSYYGTEDQLKRAISSLHTYGIKAIGDIVINHRVGTFDWGDFTHPVWGSDAVCGDDEWRGATGGLDSGTHYNAARDIDHTKEYVQKSITTWMNWLRSDIGYDGWRYDLVSGFSGRFVAKYNRATKPYISIGEFWPDHNVHNTDPSRQAICDWMDTAEKTSHAFDFTTKGILHSVFKFNDFWRLKDGAGRASGLIGWWPSKAVTFIDNHDTGPSTGGGWGQNKWAFPSDKVITGYAYTLTHPGIPSVYWTHYFDWNIKSEINNLIRIRKKYGVASDSTLKIEVADHEKYAAYVGDKLAVKIGPGKWYPGKSWNLEASGRDYMIWVSDL